MSTPTGTIEQVKISSRPKTGRSPDRSEGFRGKSEPEAKTGMPSMVDPVNSWTKKGGMFGGGLILLGSILPLLKHSFLAAGSVWVWPWTLLNQGESMEVAAATATYSTGQNYLPFALVPVVAGLLAVFLAHTTPLIIRAAGTFILGMVFLLVMLVGMPAQNEIYGLSFVPPTWEGGVMITAGILAMATVATANRLRKRHSQRKSLRIVSGIAGTVLALMFVLSLLAAQAAWTGWTVRLLSFVIIAYGALAVRGAFQQDPGDFSTRMASLAARGIAVCAPVACLIAQLTTRDPFTNFVIAGGGGFANVFFSILKCTAVYMGGAFLLAFGLAGTLTLFLGSDKSPEIAKEVE
jgi:hypothetical protein